MVFTNNSRVRRYLKGHGKKPNPLRKFAGHVARNHRLESNGSWLQTLDKDLKDYQLSQYPFIHSCEQVLIKKYNLVWMKILTKFSHLSMIIGAKLIEVVLMNT